MSRFLESVSTIISVFHQHAKEDGGCSSLSQRKMKEFIEWEFADVIAKPHDPQTIDKILQFLEWDGDGEIDFNEFLLLVFRVAKACYWYQPEGPRLRQRTELTTSGKSPQEPGSKNRGSHWQLQTREPQALPDQRSSRQANKPATKRPQRADRGSQNQPELLREERSRYNSHGLEQKPVERRRHETREPERLDPKRPHQSYVQEPLEIDLGSYQSCDVERHVDERRRDGERERECGGRGVERDQEWEEQHKQRREEPVRERRVDRELDLELDIYERRSRQTEEREERDRAKQRETRDRRDCRTEQPEEDPRRERESVRYERTRERTVAAAEADLKVHRVTRVQEPRDDLERRDRDCDKPREERRVCRGSEREEPVRERRVDRELDLELDIYERHSRQTEEREERDDRAKQRETRERRDCRTDDAEENNPRRERESVRYERTRERTVAAAEADLKVHRVTRVLEPRDAVERRDHPRDCEEPREERRVCRGPEREETVRERRVYRQRELDLELDIYERRSRRTEEREERDDRAKQRETRDRRDCRTEQPEEDPRRERESVRYERTRERTVAAAEADLKVHRVTRVQEPRDDLERRDRDCEEPREERRVCRGSEREEPVRERRVDRELDLELDIYERRSRRTREREERDDRAKQRETRDRRDCRTQDAEENNPRRDRESLRYERTRERTVAAAEADLSVHRVTRVQEPRDDLERRDRDCEEPREERRVCRGPEREEPVRERRVDRELDLELDIYERRSRQTEEREKRDDRAKQRETRDRRDCSTKEPEEDPRRERESVRYERTRERTVAAAEADLSVHRVTRVQEPRDAVERRDRVCDEPREERRVCREPETEEPVRERRVDRQRELDLELDIYERRSRQIREREERDDRAKQRETRDRRDCRTEQPEEDPRRERESVRYERTRERTVAAAEADLSVHRVTRVLEPRDDLERRDRDCEEPREERRVCRDPEREEPVRERRVDRELDLELDIYERRSRRTREREERDDRAKQRETRERRDCRTQDAEENDPRRDREVLQGESVRYERTRERTVAAAEADLKVHRVTRVQEPRDDLERRDRDCEEPREERRVCRGSEREEPVRERRVDRELDLELDIYERRSRRTREREERDDRAKQRETRDRRDCRTQDAEENNPRRDHESLRYERTRERTVAAAEADLSAHRVTRVQEPRDDLERRDRDCEEPREERRVCRGPEREEPVRERRVDRELDLELDIYERRSRQTEEREKRDDRAKQRETRDRRDCRTKEPEEDPRRERESVRYERTRERTVAAAEADLKVHRVTRVLEPRDAVERRDRDCEEPREERRVCRGPEREESVRERRVDRELDLELDIYERRSRRTREREERGTLRSSRDTRERSSLQILEEEEGDIIFSEPLDEEQRDNGLPDKDETREPTRRRVPEDGRRRRERSLYQTVVMDNRDLCPPGEQAAVSDMRIRYIPEDPEVQPEVQLLPQPCKPQTIAYLIHVIQNLNDPEATTYEITCQHPNDPGQPLYVKKCHVSPQPPAAPCDGRKRPEPRPQRGEREPLQKGDTPAPRSQENTGDPGEPQERSETGVKGACQASASEPDGVKGKTKEGRRDRQHPRLPDGEEEHQPREDGSKAAREQIPWEPESSCSLSQEAKSCPPLPQAPEPRETREPGRRGEARHCQEDAEVPLTKKSYQPRQEDDSKRNPRQGSNSQPQREEEPHLHTKQSCLVSQEAPSCPDRDETKAS